MCRKDLSSLPLLLTNMTPGTISNQKRFAFSFLLLAIVLSPLFVTPSREEVYQSIPSKVGPIAYWVQETFHKTEPVDIAIFGDSIMWAALDPIQLKEELGNQLGKKVNVINLSGVFKGGDFHLSRMVEFLEHRKTVLALFPSDRLFEKHPYAGQLLYHGTVPFTKSLPLLSQLKIYTHSVLSTPRILLNRIRRPLLAVGGFDRAAGGLTRAFGFKGTPFEEYQAPPTRILLRETSSNPETRKLLAFEETDPEAERYYQFVDEYAKSHSTQILALHVPNLWELSEGRIDTAQWLARETTPVQLLAAPPKRFFPNMPIEEIQKLYGDDTHLNKNGRRYFTSAIAPVLKELYEKHVAKD